MLRKKERKKERNLREDGCVVVEGRKEMRTTSHIFGV